MLTLLHWVTTGKHVESTLSLIRKLNQGLPSTSTTMPTHIPLQHWRQKLNYIINILLLLNNRFILTRCCSLWKAEYLLCTLCNLPFTVTWIVYTWWARVAPEELLPPSTALYPGIQARIMPLNGKVWNTCLVNTSALVSYLLLHHCNK